MSMDNREFSFNALEREILRATWEEYCAINTGQSFAIILKLIDIAPELLDFFPFSTNGDDTAANYEKLASHVEKIKEVVGRVVAGLDDADKLISFLTVQRVWILFFKWLVLSMSDGLASKPLGAFGLTPPGSVPGSGATTPAMPSTPHLSESSDAAAEGEPIISVKGTNLTFTDWSDLMANEPPMNIPRVRVGGPSHSTLEYMLHPRRVGDGSLNNTPTPTSRGTNSSFFSPKNLAGRLLRPRVMRRSGGSSFHVNVAGAGSDAGGSMSSLLHQGGGSHTLGRISLDVVLSPDQIAAVRASLANTVAAPEHATLFYHRAVAASAGLEATLLASWEDGGVPQDSPSNPAKEIGAYLVSMVSSTVGVLDQPSSLLRALSSISECYVRLARHRGHLEALRTAWVATVTAMHGEQFPVSLGDAWHGVWDLLVFSMSSSSAAVPGTLRVSLGVGAGYGTVGQEGSRGCLGPPPQSPGTTSLDDGGYAPAPDSGRTPSTSDGGYPPARDGGGTPSASDGGYAPGDGHDAGGGGEEERGRGRGGQVPFVQLLRGAGSNCSSESGAMGNEHALSGMERLTDEEKNTDHSNGGGGGDKGARLVRKERELLYRMLPRKVAHALQEGRSVVPEDYDSVTIFFSDIVGFTNIAAELAPAQVMDLLERLYTRFDRVTAKHDLFKVETIGDSYMAVSGLPRRCENHVARVAGFSVDVVKAARKVVVNPQDPSMGHVTIRVGFHSGPVVASVVGRMNPRYCLFGDTVNTASRMESTSLPGMVQMSSLSAELLMESGEDFEVCSRGMMQVKGKGEMETFFLLHPDLPDPPDEDAAAAPAPGDNSNAQQQEGQVVDHLERLPTGGNPETPAARPTDREALASSRRNWVEHKTGLRRANSLPENWDVSPDAAQSTSAGGGENGRGVDLYMGPARVPSPRKSEGQFNLRADSLPISQASSIGKSSALSFAGAPTGAHAHNASRRPTDRLRKTGSPAKNIGLAFPQM